MYANKALTRGAFNVRLCSKRVEILSVRLPVGSCVQRVSLSAFHLHMASAPHRAANYTSCHRKARHMVPRAAAASVSHCIGKSRSPILGLAESVIITPMGNGNGDGISSSLCAAAAPVLPAGFFAPHRAAFRVRRARCRSASRACIHCARTSVLPPNRAERIQAPTTLRRTLRFGVHRTYCDASAAARAPLASESPLAPRPYAAGCGALYPVPQRVHFPLMLGGTVHRVALAYPRAEFRPLRRRRITLRVLERTAPRCPLVEALASIEIKTPGRRADREIPTHSTVQVERALELKLKTRIPRCGRCRTSPGPFFIAIGYVSARGTSVHRNAPGRECNRPWTRHAARALESELKRLPQPQPGASRLADAGGEAPGPAFVHTCPARSASHRHALDVARPSASAPSETVAPIICAAAAAVAFACAALSGAPHGTLPERTSCPTEDTPSALLLPKLAHEQGQAGYHHHPRAVYLVMH
ncbi:hypothetical protein HYPSUDRAFT_56860 [Hypholoma sublateritium FD-334 SS-4]|uniref:Uncharacterized protein n=1 Tax=Hypholoma sublateritium (strain FD-334 SS-4) TaxID=945553 RepID=A0A0D2NJG2_HYPSF|nr:hypothetical protein HYPSUDRAFT_56860 [Hypholoma sublateritium FD-334 SS-4]